MSYENDVYDYMMILNESINIVVKEFLTYEYVWIVNDISHIGSDIGEMFSHLCLD